MSASRAQLERIRARGGRLVAEDAERLNDLENEDAWFCSSCHCYFASPFDAADVAQQKGADHYRGVMHARS